MIIADNQLFAKYYVVLFCQYVIFAYICKNFNNMNQNELACSVEEVTCECVGLPLGCLFEQTKKGDYVKARHLSIFILHTLYHIPTYWLSRRYRCSQRHIFMVVAQVRDYISTNKTYRELVAEITNRLSILPPSTT